MRRVSDVARRLNVVWTTRYSPSWPLDPSQPRASWQALLDGLGRLASEVSGARSPPEPRSTRGLQPSRNRAVNARCRRGSRRYPRTYLVSGNILRPWMHARARPVGSYRQCRRYVVPPAFPGSTMNNVPVLLHATPDAITLADPITRPVSGFRALLRRLRKPRPTPRSRILSGVSESFITERIDFLRLDVVRNEAPILDLGAVGGANLLQLMRAEGIRRRGCGSRSEHGGARPRIRSRRANRWTRSSHWKPSRLGAAGFGHVSSDDRTQVSPTRHPREMLLAALLALPARWRTGGPKR